MLKVEGGTVFINEDSMLRDVHIYDATVVLMIPKGAQWSQEYAKEFLDKHTDGEVRISMCNVMDQTGYAAMQKKEGEAHAALEKLAELVKQAHEEHETQRKEPAFKRFIKNLIKGEAK